MLVNEKLLKGSAQVTSIGVSEVDRTMSLHLGGLANCIGRNLCDRPES